MFDKDGGGRSAFSGIIICHTAESDDMSAD